MNWLALGFGVLAFGFLGLALHAILNRVEAKLAPPVAPPPQVLHVKHSLDSVTLAAVGALVERAIDRRVFGGDRLDRARVDTTNRAPDQLAEQRATEDAVARTAARILSDYQAAGVAATMEQCVSEARTMVLHARGPA